MSVIDEYFYKKDNEFGLTMYVRKTDDKVFPPYYLQALNEEEIKKIGSGESTPQFLVD